MTDTDKESAKALRRKRNLKCLAYIIIGVILQTAIIMLFVLTVMRIRNLKVRQSEVTVESLKTNSSAESPSFSMKLNALVTIKNTNFGSFKFEDSIATVFYRGTPVGQAIIVKGRARWRSTKKINITVDVLSEKVSKNSQLGSDLDSGILTLTSHAELSGKIKLLGVIKKKKSAEMNCIMEVNTTTKEIMDLTCS